MVEETSLSTVADAGAVEEEPADEVVRRLRKISVGFW